MQANQDSPYTSMHLRTSRKSAARTCFLDHYTARTQSINFLYATTSKSFPDTFYLYKMYVQKIIHCSVTFDESTGNFPCWSTSNSDRNDPVEELHHGMLQPNLWVLVRSSHTRDRFGEDRQLLLLRKRF